MSSASGSSTCTPCEPGSYSLAEASTSCTNCDAGRYSFTPSATSAEACLACENGKAASLGSSACSTCNHGTSSDDQTHCICGLGRGTVASSDGKFLPATGQLKDGTSVRIRNSSDFSPIFDSEGVVSGRAEVYHNGQWGTICSDKFASNDALVFCRQLGSELGYSLISGTVVSSSNTPVGSGQIWLDDLACSGTEETLDECTHPGWGNHNCGHDEDVGVSCKFGEDAGTDCDVCPAGKFSGIAGYGRCSSCPAGHYR